MKDMRLCTMGVGCAEASRCYAEGHDEDDRCPLKRPQIVSDDDCEDQALMATKNCTKCRTGFTEGGAPICPALVKRGAFWCCPVCLSSYGTNPHPNLT